MQDFEQKRNEYFKKLRENFNVVELLTNNENTNKEEKQKLLELILTPSTKNELEFANLYFDLTQEIMLLENDVISDNVKEIDLSNSAIIKFYIDLINALKSGDTYKIEECRKILKELNNPELTAILCYEFIVVFKGRCEEQAFNKIIVDTGFNIDDGLSLMQFQIYLMKANLITNSKEKSNFDLNDSTQLKSFSEYTKKFHELYILGKKNQNIEENKKIR